MEESRKTKSSGEKKSGAIGGTVAGNGKAKGPSECDSDRITILKDREAVRLRPAMWVGSTGELGLHYLVREAIYDALCGDCDRVDVTIHRDNSITVADNGRAISPGMHRHRKISTAEVDMTTLCCGSGERGLRLPPVNFLSEWLELEIWHDGNTYKQEYARGVPQARLRQTGKTKKRGTRISFKPDPQIFEVLEFNFDTLSRQMREEPILSSGIRITLTHRTKENHEFFFQVTGDIARSE